MVPARLKAGSVGGSVLSVLPVTLGVPPAWLPDELSVTDFSSSSVALPFTLASRVGAVEASNKCISYV